MRSARPDEASACCGSWSEVHVHGEWRRLWGWWALVAVTRPPSLRVLQAEGGLHVERVSFMIREGSVRDVVTGTWTGCRTKSHYEAAEKDVEKRCSSAASAEHRTNPRKVWVLHAGVTKSHTFIR